MGILERDEDLTKVYKRLERWVKGQKRKDGRSELSVRDVVQETIVQLKQALDRGLDERAVVTWVGLALYHNYISACRVANRLGLPLPHESSKGATGLLEAVHQRRVREARECDEYLLVVKDRVHATDDVLSVVRGGTDEDTERNRLRIIVVDAVGV